VRVSSWLCGAGTTFAPADGAAVGGDDIAAQTFKAIRGISVTLKELGRTDRRDADAHLLTDISRWEEVGRAHGEFFADTPASSMVEVAALVEPALLAEVETDALLPEEDSPSQQHGCPASTTVAMTGTPVRQCLSTDTTATAGSRPLCGTQLQALLQGRQCSGPMSGRAAR
jgi:enamine deaminase RidA (YjgF/YER057c/UK114 family)